MNTSIPIPSEPNLIGYRKHPRYRLWARERCAYFVSDYGRKLKHTYTPFMRSLHKERGYMAPTMRSCRGKACHILMGEIFYGERPTFIDSKGKPYYGVCHHLIENPLDYRPENLLCWLSRSEHSKADKRRRALESVAPDGNLYDCFTYERLRELQDPRILSDEQFQAELEAIRAKGFHKVDVEDQMNYEITHHVEFLDC